MFYREQTVRKRYEFSRFGVAVINGGGNPKTWHILLPAFRLGSNVRRIRRRGGFRPSEVPGSRETGRNPGSLRRSAQAVRVFPAPKAPLSRKIMQSPAWMKG